MSDEIVMPEVFLHHVSISCTNLEISVNFYCAVLGLSVLQRPPFKSQGAWLACGSQHLHLNLKATAPFAADKGINPTEPHFALRCSDFDAMLAHLAAAGFREEGAETDPLRMLVDRHGPAGFPQVFLLDPDRNTVEINAAG
ncbi:MAG: VOC family protein [Rhodobacterales bacterium]|nr:VOC family protein [Rhodobacterales bacterium]